MTEAAYTQPGGSCPGYINVRPDPTGKGVEITVRSPTPAPAPSGDGIREGVSATIFVPLEEFHQLLADMMRICASGGVSLAGFPGTSASEPPEA